MRATRTLTSERIENLDSHINLSALNEMIEHHLLNALVESERPETVVETVLSEYSKDLLLSGKTPVAFLDEVLEELREIVLEVVRKRTYGCMTISAYKNQFKDSR